MAWELYTNNQKKTTELIKEIDLIRSSMNLNRKKDGYVMPNSQTIRITPN